MSQKLDNIERYDQLFKVILAGDTNVGKTNLVQAFYRYVPISNNRQYKQQKNNNFPINNFNIAPTIGAEFSTRIVQLNNHKKIKIQLWDTAGQEQYRSITTAHYRKALGALVVYDITKQKTFHSIKKWIESIRQQADPNIVIFLIGNKIDQKDRQQVNQVDARKFANSQGIFFQQTSALTNQNVYQTFMKLIQQIYRRMAEKQAKSQGITQVGQTLHLDNRKSQQEKCQC